MTNTENIKSIINIEIGKTKLIAIFAASVLFYLFALLLWKENTIDSNIVIHFNYIYENEATLRLIKLISRYGMPCLSVLYALFLVLTFRIDTLKPERSLFFIIIISFFLTTIGGDGLKELVDKSRPVIALAGQVAIKQISATSAFPSGHAAKSMALAIPFVLLASQKNRINIIYKVAVLLVAGLVCYSRIAQQAHFLSDVLAGIGTALFFFPFSVWITNIFYRKSKMDEKKLGILSQRFIFIFLAFAAVLCFM